MDYFQYDAMAFTPSDKDFTLQNCTRVCEGWKLVFINIYSGEPESDPICTQRLCGSISMVNMSLWIVGVAITLYMLRNLRSLSSIGFINIFQYGLITLPILQTIRYLITIPGVIDNWFGYIIYSFIYILLQVGIGTRILDLLVVKILNDMVYRLISAKWMVKSVKWYIYIGLGINIIFSLILYVLCIITGINSGANDTVYLLFTISSYTFDILSGINILLVLIYLIYIAYQLLQFKTLSSQTKRRANRVRNMAFSIFVIYFVTIIVAIGGRPILQLIFSNMPSEGIGMINNAIIEFAHHISIVLIVAPKVNKTESRTESENNSNMNSQSQELGNNSNMNSQSQELENN